MPYMGNMTDSLCEKSTFVRYCQRYCGTRLAVPCTGANQLPKQGHVVLYGTNDRVLTEVLTGNGNTGLDVEMTKNPDHPKNNLFRPRILIGPTKYFQKTREMIGRERS